VTNIVLQSSELSWIVLIQFMRLSRPYRHQVLLFYRHSKTNRPYHFTVAFILSSQFLFFVHAVCDRRFNVINANRRRTKISLKTDRRSTFRPSVVDCCTTDSNTKIDLQSNHWATTLTFNILSPGCCMLAIPMSPNNSSLSLSPSPTMFFSCRVKRQNRCCCCCCWYNQAVTHCYTMTLLL
jgi:hypothetical protein